MGDISDEQGFREIGNLDSTCPNCGTQLEVRPSRKKKCPHCGEFIYVRTRPADRARVLVNEAEAKELEIQWSLASGTRQPLVQDEEHFEMVRSQLADRFAQEPADNDVWWSIYNTDLVERTTRGDWGLYRNTRFSMGELLRSEGKPHQSLEAYLEVSYLDSNGPRNLGGRFDPNLLKNFPPFEREMAFQAPGVIERISRVMDYLEMDIENLKAVYLSVAERLRQRIHSPVKAEDAWNDLSSELRAD